MLIVEGIRRFGDIDHFLRGVCAASRDCCCGCLCAVGLVVVVTTAAAAAAAADLEVPMAGSW